MLNFSNKKRVTCTSLWNKWQKHTSDKVLLLHAQKKISSYKKDDWELMVKEVRELIFYFEYLINTNAMINSEESKIGFDMFIDHYVKWFHPIDEDYLLKLIMHIKTDKDFIVFFENQTPGLGVYLPKLIEYYSHTVKNTVE
jgi:hypothetical protein